MAFGKIKQVAMGMITAAPVARMFSPFLRDAVPILFFHRFTRPGETHRGYAADALRRLLEGLRRDGFQLLPLSAVTDDPERARGAGRAVAFTVDDGYRDFFTVAAPIFLEFDCPVTVFLTTGFIDRATWMWWDQIVVALAKCTAGSCEIAIDGVAQHFAWTDPGARTLVADEIIERLKTVPDAQRRAAIADLWRQGAGGAPDRAPDEYGPMSWSEIAELAKRGVTFGPHTVTHPILSRVTDAEAEYEIAGSWERLRTQLPGALPVFCYPNGSPRDFSAREITLVRGAGLSAAVTTRQDYARRAGPRGDAGYRYTIPRFVCPTEPSAIGQIVWGVARAKTTVLRSEIVG